MNFPKNPSHPFGNEGSKTAESTPEENSALNPQDFPSGDEEDRAGGNAGPEEKRHPDGGVPLQNVSLSEKEKSEAADWSKRTPAGTPEKPGTENPATYK